MKWIKNNKISEIVKFSLINRILNTPNQEITTVITKYLKEMI